MAYSSSTKFSNDTVLEKSVCVDSLLKPSIVEAAVMLEICETLVTICAILIVSLILEV